MTCSQEKDDASERLFQLAVRPLRATAITLCIGFIGLFIWATNAPLSTTIRANGLLVSSQPSFEIQHPYGGSIKRVFVKLFDKVEKGEAILALDMSRQRKSLDQIEAQISQAHSENEVIQSILSSQSLAGPSQQSKMLMRHYMEKQNELTVSLTSAIESSQTLDNQIASTEQSLLQMHETLELMLRQEARITEFRDQGIRTASEVDEMRMRSLTMASDIAEKEASLAALRDRAQKSQKQAELLSTRFRLDLLERFTSNEARLPELERRAISLRDELSNAVIRAPVAGNIGSLEFGTEAMFVPRGQTIATIARPLENPTIHFTIPVASIEQTFVGMTGTVTLSSLPQRNLPKITAEVTSISPEAIKDETGNPIGFTATAEFNREELKTALQSLEQKIQLSTDMPVSLALSGRTITFADYLIAPFFKIYEGALQD